MTHHPLSSAWVASVLARTDTRPAVQREPLWWGRHRIGSVEHDVPRSLGLPQLVHERDGWRVHGELTRSLGQVADALLQAGLLRSWRNEQVVVIDADGARLGTVERGAVRVLGIPTHAVHMIGVAPDGAHWVQQRAFDKATDPGMWDTLVGGLVAADESPESALARETWEEAGLRIGHLQDVTWAGHVVTRRPSAEQPHGYVEERLDWVRCVVPEGVQPCNQDGEVAQFRRMDSATLAAGLERDAFTLDAALVFIAAFDAGAPPG